MGQPQANATNQAQCAQGARQGRTGRARGTLEKEALPSWQVALRRWSHPQKTEGVVGEEILARLVAEAKDVVELPQLLQCVQGLLSEVMGVSYLCLNAIFVCLTSVLPGANLQLSLALRGGYASHFLFLVLMPKGLVSTT